METIWAEKEQEREIKKKELQAQYQNILKAEAHLSELKKDLNENG